MDAHPSCFLLSVLNTHTHLRARSPSLDRSLSLSLYHVPLSHRSSFLRLALICLSSASEAWTKCRSLGTRLTTLRCKILHTDSCYPPPPPSPLNHNHWRQTFDVPFPRKCRPDVSLPWLFYDNGDGHQLWRIIQRREYGYTFTCIGNFPANHPAKTIRWQVKVQQSLYYGICN